METFVLICELWTDFFWKELWVRSRVCVNSEFRFETKFVLYRQDSVEQNLFAVLKMAPSKLVFTKCCIFELMAIMADEEHFNSLEILCMNSKPCIFTTRIFILNTSILCCVLGNLYTVYCVLGNLFTVYHFIFI